MADKTGEFQILFISHISLVQLVSGGRGSDSYDSGCVAPFQDLDDVSVAVDHSLAGTFAVLVFYHNSNIRLYRSALTLAFRRQRLESSRSVWPV